MKTRFRYSLIVVVALALSAVAQSPCDDLSIYPVRFAILGDRTGSHQQGVFGACVEEVARLRPDFVMTVGDMIEGYTSDTIQMRKEWEEYYGLLEPLNVPIYHTPGNHDITSDVMEPVYRSFVGEPNYSFDHRGIHIVVLDNSRLNTSEDFSEEQLDWLRKDLASSHDACYTLVFYHQPFWYRTLGDGQEDILHNIFKAHGVDAVFTGHFHKYFSGEYDGILYTSLGSSGGATEESPTGLLYHFGWVTIDGLGIHAVPVKKGAVLPWDIQPVMDLRDSYLVQHLGMRFSQPLSVAAGLSLSTDAATVVLTNLLLETEYTDTLRWDVPDGWSVEPDTYPFDLAGAKSLSVPFTVHLSDKLYPLPTLSTHLPYAEDKTININQTLEIARAVVSVYALGDITIDGQLTEACWQEPFVALLDHEGELTERDSIAVCFAYNKDNLYMAVYCHESVMDSLFADMTERDAEVYTEDAFGFLFQPNPPNGDVYQFYANPLGTVYDQHIVRQTDGYWTGNPSWNGKYEVKTSLGEDYYRLEVCFPMDQFGYTINPGDKWRVNFRRKQRHTNTAYALQVPWAYDPTSFGVLVF